MYDLLLRPELYPKPKYVTNTSAGVPLQRVRKGLDIPISYRLRIFLASGRAAKAFGKVFLFLLPDMFIRAEKQMQWRIYNIQEATKVFSFLLCSNAARRWVPDFGVCVVAFVLLP
jgi:hypothetical protein